MDVLSASRDDDKIAWYENGGYRCNSGELWDESSEICIPCPNPSWCPDGLTCIDGHERLGCAQCSNNYFLLNDSCQKCPNNSFLIFLILGIIFSVFCIVVYKLSGKHVDPSTLAVINMSITHFQTIAICIHLKFKIPLLFVEIINWIQILFGFFFVDLIASPECQVDIGFYDKWLILSFFPMILFALFSILYCLPTSKKFDNKMIKMMALVCSVMYIYSISQTFKMWDCIKLEDGSYVLESDPNIKCFDGGKWAWMATLSFFMLLIYIFLPPSYLWNALKSSNRSSDESKDKYGWLYLRYKEKDDYWSWEPCVEMPKKFFVVFWSTFMPEQHSQSAMILVNLLWFWFFHAVCQPYNDQHTLFPNLENNLQNYLYGFEVTLLIGMWIYSSVGGNENVAISVFLIIYFIGVLNILYHIILLKIRQKSNRGEDYKKEKKRRGKIEMIAKVFADG